MSLDRPRRRDRRDAGRRSCPSEVDPTVFDEALPSAARAAAAAHEVAGPRRAEGRPAQRQARPVGRVRGLPRLHPRRRPAPARLERLRPPRAAVREALRRGGGRHRHFLLDASASMAPGDPAKLLFAKRAAAALGYIGLASRGPGRGQRAVRTDRAGVRSRCAARAASSGSSPTSPRSSRPTARPTCSPRHDTPRRSSTAAASSSSLSRPPRPGGRPGHPRARRDRLGADRPPRPVAGGARPVDRGRPPAGRRRDRRGHRRHRRPRHDRRLQGATRRLAGGLRRPAAKRRASYVPISHGPAASPT